MSFDCGQFRRLIEEVLRSYPELNSPAAVNLLLGTAAQESAFGTYFWQRGGPALGVFQMEPRTYQWLTDRYAATYPAIAGQPPEDMTWNLKLAILMARLRYRPEPTPLPAADDLPGLAAYWDDFYNRNKIDERNKFMEKYRKYVKEV